MFTDVVGYSSIAGSDESRALRLLAEHRRILEGVFPKYEGRVVKTMGDAFLVEFASAVEAVNCSVEVQEEMRRFNSDRPQSEKVLVRIGIHVGDIVHSGGDVLGDAVNVAARVEPLAEPGGICVTRQVVDQVQRKVGHKLLSLGTRELKNIQTPVEIYRIVLPGEMNRSDGEVVLDPRRVAILPFTNMSGDPEDRYFADGMTEELISTVSRIGELSVISRTSVMRYRDTTVPIGQIGHELAAGSVLEGSVRKAGNRVRITAQLIDAGNDRHLWSQSYDRDLVDVFAIQGDIAQQVAESLKVELLEKVKDAVKKKATSNPEAYTVYLKGRFSWNERTEESLWKAVRYFEEAVKLDPEYAAAYSGLADCYLILFDYGWLKPNEAGPVAKKHALRALELDDTLAEAHASLSLALSSYDWDFVGAEREIKRALELNPNYSTAYHWYSVMLEHLLRFEEASEMELRAYKLDPYSRVVSMGIGVNMLYLGRLAEALEQLERVRKLNPDFAAVYYWETIVHVLMKNYDLAKEVATKSQEFDKTGTSAKMNLAWVYAIAGEAETAKQLVNKAISEVGSSYLSPVLVGQVFLALGDDEKGFRWIRRGYEERDGSLIYFRSFPWLSEQRSDPRWLEIESKLGLPPPR